MATLCDLGWSLATFSLFVEDILANFHPQLALQIPIKSMPSSANYQTYLDDVDGVDERDGDDGGSSGHADLLEESRGGGGAGGHRPGVVGREGGVGEAHFDVCSGVGV